MDWMTDEILFYGGMAAAVISIVGAAVFFLISKIRGIRLSLKLDEEYGKRMKNGEIKKRMKQ